MIAPLRTYWTKLIKPRESNFIDEILNNQKLYYILLMLKYHPLDREYIKQSTIDLYFERYLNPVHANIFGYTIK